MNKIFCDRCKKEIKLGEQSYLKISQAEIGYPVLREVFSPSLELCRNCISEIIKFIERKI